MADKIIEIKFPPCPVCLTNKAVMRRRRGKKCSSLLCDEERGGCGEQTAIYDNLAAAIAPWARAAKERAKLLALVPALSEELPTKTGLWWWWNGINICEAKIKTIIGQDERLYCWDRQLYVDDMGGWWAECLAPELPKGEG